MDQEYKARWLAALRSGEFKQGRGELRSADDKYCCLGVICTLVPGVTWRRLADGRFDYEAEFKGVYDSGFLSRRLLDITGIDSGKQDRLSSMNDDGNSFPQIADYIEANL